jgi:potassium efflux system protein
MSPKKNGSGTNGRTTSSPTSHNIRLFKQIAHLSISSLYIPLILYFGMCFLQPAGDTATVRGAIYSALAGIIGPITAVIILTGAVRPNGLAERQVGWSPMVCYGLHLTLFRIVSLVMPLMGLSLFFRVYAGGTFNDSLGRWSLMGSMFVLGMSMLSAGNAIVFNETRRNDSRPTFWFAGGKLFRLLSAAVPVSLVFIAAIGYRFAAEQLGWRLIWSLLAVVGILLVFGMVSKLLVLNLNRLQKRLELDAKGRSESNELLSNHRQVIQLARMLVATFLLVVIGRIWLEVVPIGTYLSGFHLWDRATDAANLGPVTGWELLLAVGVIVLAGSFSRNLQGLLEMVLPARLPLDRGGRYAVTFVVRYFVLLVGLIQAASLLGFAWERVQWLAAGLTVGLGFGLQEIFANLISGIIILIERPVRVGDYVTVNNVTGTVTKMALRATTIQDSDRREWIVPNKKFITDDVMNWTLTDTISRAVFLIGVAYGSDVELVRQTLLNIARQHKQVLDFPEPDAVLSKFGATTLDFELRVYIPSRNVFTQVQNDLHVAIHSAFRANNIEWAGWKNSPSPIKLNPPEITKAA